MTVIINLYLGSMNPRRELSWPQSSDPNIYCTLIAGYTAINAETAGIANDVNTETTSDKVTTFDTHVHL